ncbi:hypothetical protein BD779DRAFT_1677283 [Infundibulicybe gibba]|nr:hypothetical protein BD779DRAFT_1677283 [Infundibulicybe gibba]
MRRHAIIFTILLAQFSTATLKNQTIDDYLGDSSTGFKVQYAPPTDSGGGAVWRSQDNCETCAILADRAKTYNNTWTSATYLEGSGNYTAALQFHGTAIYVYFIISNYPRSTKLISAVECGFRLDGAIVGNYTHQSDESYIFQYNTLAALLMSSSTMHNIRAFSSFSGQFVYSLFNSDRTDVLEPSPTTTSSSSPSSSISSTNPPGGKRNVLAIVGWTLGSLGGLIWILAFCLLQRRWREKPGYQRDLQMQSLTKGDSLEAHISPFLLEEHAELEQQLRERTAARGGGTPTLPVPVDTPRAAADDSDLRQQVVAMRLQLQRLESQQATTAARPFTPYRDAGTTAPVGSRMERRPAGALAAGSSTRAAEVVVHTDSGLRLGAAPRPIELPPTYALE